MADSYNLTEGGEVKWTLMAEPVVLSCVNLKGGVGKTALAVNFAAYCGRSGKKTLLIDLDPQTNATFSCIATEEWEEHAKKKGTVADLLGARRYASAEDRTKTPEEVVRAAVFANVDLLPSHLDLFTVDLDLAAATARETKLRRALSGFIKKYEIVVCDCPPNLTIPTQNAIAMSSHYVVPVSPDYLSGIGIGLLVTRVKTLSAALEHEVKHSGIVISRVGRPAQFRVIIYLTQVAHWRRILSWSPTLRPAPFRKPSSTSPIPMFA